MDYKPEIILPKRYEKVDYKDVPAGIKKHFEQIPATRKGLYIHGGVGSGKTHIAYALYKFVREKNQSCRFWNTTELFREIRLDINRHPSDKRHTEESLLEHPGLLILDDIGAEKLSDWVLETFYLIINRRYEDMLPTIFTSNLSIADLAAKIGDRTVSRIVEMCDIVPVEGKDRRLKLSTK